MNVTAIDQDKDLSDLLAAQRGVPAEAREAKARLEDAKTAFALARRNFHSVSARASLGQASKAEAKSAEQALDRAADELRKAEDHVEILSEKVAVLATAIADTMARRRKRILPDVKAEGERIVGEAAAAFATLARLAVESKALKTVLDGDFLLDITAGGFAIHAAEVAELGNVPAVCSMLSGKTFLEATLDKWTRVSK